VCREGYATLLCPHLGICSLHPHKTPGLKAADPPLLPLEVLIPLLLVLLPGPRETKPFHRSQRKCCRRCSQSLLPGRARLSPCRSRDDERLVARPVCSLLQFAQRALRPLDDFLIRVASLDRPPHADTSVTHCWHGHTDHRCWSRLPCSVPGHPSALQTAAPAWPASGERLRACKGTLFPLEQPTQTLLPHSSFFPIP